MADMTFEEIVQAARNLNREQKAALIYSLQSDVPADDSELNRQQALAELDALRAAGAFNQVESLKGKYAGHGVEVSDEELNAYLSKISRAWESELDDIDND